MTTLLVLVVIVDLPLWTGLTLVTAWADWRNRPSQDPVSNRPTPAFWVNLASVDRGRVG